jgi:PTS system nitrogen regulatory IIA component
MPIAELIAAQNLFYIVDPYDIAETLGQLVRALPLPAELDGQALLNALLDREEVMSTAIGNGIAIPHVRRFGSESLQQDIVVVAYLFAPVDWKAPDGLPVHTLFLVLAKDEASHLELLAEIAHVASDERFVEFLKTMPERDALVERIQAFEESSAAKS